MVATEGAEVDRYAMYCSVVVDSSTNSCTLTLFYTLKGVVLGYSGNIEGLTKVVWFSGSPL